MNQAELIIKTAQATGVPKTAVEDVLKAAANIVTACLITGEDTALPGIGKLVTSHKQARVGRNPKTGEAHPIPAHNVVKFRVAKALKDAVAG